VSKLQQTRRVKFFFGFFGPLFYGINLANGILKLVGSISASSLRSNDHPILGTFFFYFFCFSELLIDASVAAAARNRIDFFSIFCWFCFSFRQCLIVDSQE